MSENINKSEKIKENKGKKKLGFGSVIPILLVLAACISPTCYLYNKNVGAIPFTEALLMIAISALIGLPVFALIYLVIRFIVKRKGDRNIQAGTVAGLTGFICMTLFFNINLLRGIGSALFGRPTHSLRVAAFNLLLSLILILGSMIVIFILAKKQPEFLSFMSKVLLLISAAMLAINTLAAIPSMISQKNQTAVTVETPEAVTEVLPFEERPNVYYFLLDEYADFGAISKYYDYDNSEFRDFLEENGFGISDSSYTYVNAGTYRNMANICHLQNVDTEGLGDLECQSLITDENAALYRAWDILGYSQYQASSFDLYATPSVFTPTGLKELFTAQTESGESLYDIVMNNSMLYEAESIISVVTDYQNRNGKYMQYHAGQVNKVFDYYNDGGIDYSGSNKIYYSYFMCPHAPFVFDAEGNLLDASVLANWEDNEYYLGQYKYMTVRMTETLTKILENDPEAIIIIQSDHGLRHTAGVSALESMCIFNAVYYGGKPVDIEGLSGVDTLRYVLSESGLDYPPIGYEDDHIMFDEIAE